MNQIVAVLAASVLLSAAGQLAFAQSDKLAVLDTNQGQIVIEFFPADAPNHVANFIELSESGFYDGTLFHRIIPDFMIQGGDPNTIDGDPATWGTGGPGSMLEAEFNTIKHNRGIVSMARSFDHDSAGSQFFIVHQDSNFLDQEYTVFGRIVTQESFQTLDKIASLATAFNDAPVETEEARIIKATTVLRSEVSDILTLEPPDRVSADMSAPPPMLQGQVYDDPELGVKFTAPDGWLLQKPNEADPFAPDIIAIGPPTDDLTMPPFIALIVSPTDGKSFDQVVQEKMDELEQPIAEGILEILSQEETTLLGRTALQTVVVGSPAGDAGPLAKMNEYLVYDSEKFYTLFYMNEADRYDSFLPQFIESVEAFEIYGTDMEPAETTMEATEPATDTMEPAEPDTAAEGGGCLIATAAFGSEMAPQVQLLREIRDSKVMNTESGSAFMAGFNQIYYAFSPAVADMQRQSPVFKEAVKLAITPMLSSLSVLNYADIDSEYDILSYGLAVIALNLGMYVAAPAIIIYGIKR